MKLHEAMSQVDKKEIVKHITRAAKALADLLEEIVKKVKEERKQKP